MKNTNKNTIPSVTIAVSAYNEGRNIKKFLESILMQKEEGFVLDAIWVYSDGSTDKTVEMARSLKSKKIKIIDDKKRLGKSTRLNDIYKKVESDYLVQSDADVIFSHEYVVRDIIQPLIENSKVGMCGGNPMGLPPSTFWEKAVRVACDPYQDFRAEVRGGNNVFSAVGQILAYRKEFLKSITVPTDMITNDLYTYFCCLTHGWKYRYVKSAVVFFQSPKRLRDLLRQNTRFHSGHIRMFEYFKSELVKKETSIPRYARYKSLLKQFIKYPVHASVYFIVNIYAKINAINSGRKLNAKWQIAITTKNLNKS